MKNPFTKSSVNIKESGKEQVIAQVKKNVDKQLTKKQDEVFDLVTYAIKQLMTEKYEDLMADALLRASKEVVQEKQDELDKKDN